MATTPEGKFQTKVAKLLNSLGDDCWFTVMQAGSIRGLPDILGCYKGHLFGWELKKNLAETRKQTGRIVLQNYRIRKIRHAGGIGELVCPETLAQKFQELLSSTL